MKKLSALVIVLLVVGIAWAGWHFYSRTRPVPPPSSPANELIAVSSDPSLPAAVFDVPGVAGSVTATSNVSVQVRLASATGTPAPAAAPRRVEPVETRSYQNLKLKLPPAMEKTARSAACGLLIDVKNQRILWSYDADSVHQIASMTKIMTVLVAMETIENNPNLTLDSPAAVSKDAMKQGGSQLYLEAGYSYPYRQMLQACMIHSANDAAWVVGENIGGTMDNFTVMMNRRARQLNMQYARFYNPNGLPGSDANHDNRATCYDMANLALAMRAFPEVYEWSATKTIPFTHGNGKTVNMENKNRLIGNNNLGINGLKTGYISRSGFCVTLTAEQNGNQLLAVVMDFGVRDDRDTFMKDLIAWGYGQVGSSPAPTR